MPKITYIENKHIDWVDVQKHLSSSMELNHWANFGPAVTNLEIALRETLNQPPNCEIITFSSGTAALHTLINYCITRKPWAVSSYGFYCTKQGPLADAVVIDCDEKGMLDLSQIDPTKIGGIVVTNLFGLYDLGPYADYCNNWGLKLICDAAMAYDSNHQENSIISFHQTKPWGIGEGGCAIVAENIAKEIRAYSNFGVSGYKKILDNGTNAKMSDVQAAMILSRFKKHVKIRNIMRNEYHRITTIAGDLGFRCLSANHPGWPSNVPLLAPIAIPEDRLTNPLVTLKKYYIPLESTPNASYIYDHVVNFPCHPGVVELQNSDIYKVLNNILQPAI